MASWMEAVNTFMPDTTKTTTEWFKQADYDFGTAEAMFRSRRYIYAVFMCHLCIEKGLKGLIANRGEIPSRSHDLLYLLEISAGEVNERFTGFIEALNEVSVPTRYPDELDRLVAQYPRKRTAEVISNAREVLTWLKSCL
jgi:HEPN domain-containing protein